TKRRVAASTKCDRSREKDDQSEPYLADATGRESRLRGNEQTPENGDDQRDSDREHDANAVTSLDGGRPVAKRTEGGQLEKKSDRQVDDAESSQVFVECGRLGAHQ